MQEKGGELKELLTRKEPELKNLENSQLIHFAKKWGRHSVENTKGVLVHLIRLVRV